jgi:hypothetical protein
VARSELAKPRIGWPGQRRRRGFRPRRPPAEEARCRREILASSPSGSAGTAGSTGGEIDRLDDDQLARLTEEERVAAGLAPFDPDEVPPATDTPPQTGVSQSAEYRQERAESRREYDKGELYPVDEDHPLPPTRYE